MNVKDKLEFKRSCILPMVVVDDQGEICEITICDSISGGANEINNMPRNISLQRKKLVNGVWKTYNALYRIKEY